MKFQSPEFLFDLERRTKRLLQVAIDVLLLCSCFIAAMALRLEELSFLRKAEIWLSLAIFLPVTIIVLAKLGFYRIIIRYISRKAIETIATGVSFSALILFAMAQFFAFPIPRSVPAIYALLAFVSLGGTRLLMRVLVERYKYRLKRSVIIYGAGNSGRQLLTVLGNGTEYLVVGFVDDNEKLHFQEVAGVPVYPPGRLDELIKRFEVQTVLLAVPKASRKERQKIIKQFDGSNVTVRTIPRLEDLVGGKAKVNDLQVVAVEDLLGRDPVPPINELLSKNVFGKTVMVTGAGGSIGSELCRQILMLGVKKLVLLDISEFSLYEIDEELKNLANSNVIDIQIVPIIGSVQNKGRMVNLIKRLEIQTIFHAAAYKHVPLVELNIIEGIRNNVFGTKTILEAAIAGGVENFTLISTDKAVRPTNFMGASKRVAELVCQAAAESQNATKVSMVRFGNVLGSSGSVIPRFRSLIEKGSPVSVTHPDVTRYFMTIPEAAQLVIQASAMGRSGDVFILDMGEPIKVVDLAQRMIRLYGLQPFFPNSSELGPSNGDIAITFSGLRKGEKLYEELLVGNSPSETVHPRIFTASEIMMSSVELEKLLEDLLEACLRYNTKEIGRILRDAPIGFNHAEN